MGSTLGTVQCIDGDGLPENSQIQYSIEPASTGTGILN